MELYFDENNGEHPLDRLLPDGGFSAIFRTMACIGDSLSSGEFQDLDENGNNLYFDFYEQSWGQYLARMNGSKVYNFSRGGMSAKWYCETFAEEKDFWSQEKACQAYIIALGVNDIHEKDFELGKIEDICMEDYRQNKKNFAGYYGQILQRYHAIQPDAKFFLMTMPRGVDSDKETAQKKAHAALLYDMAKKFSNTYVLDFNQYAPVYDKTFREHYCLYGHMTPTGYLLTAKMVASYIDYIIRHRYADFRRAGFIGTDRRG